MEDVPRSEQFDDIYFSVENGLEETKHVFLNGNNLPHAWEDKDSFVIAETGFGTGLNFLSAWKLFEETTAPHQTLDFISVEKYPLTPEYIGRALSHWADYFKGRIEVLCDHYPLRIEGFHRLKISPQITLTLIFDTAEAVLPQIEAAVNCWFLDGFTPSKNPAMWTPKIFEQMARLSVGGTSFSSFTAAGDVRRGLQTAGFSVQKTKGFGRKREMISGVFAGEKTAMKKPAKPKNIAIIGGGLAGTACAYVLKQYGFNPVIYEAGASLAAGASGNSTGFYAPRFNSQRDAISNFFIPAYTQFIRLARQAGEEIEYDPCGELHFINTPEKQKRFDLLVKNCGWHEDHVHFVDAEEASTLAGIKIDEGALYLPDSGSVNPSKLCKFYAEGVEVHLNTKITDLSALDADAIILCNAYSVKDFDCLDWLPLESVRGQISILSQTEKSKNLKCHIHFGGYLSAAREGVHKCGATFQKWYDHTDLMAEDHAANIYNAKQNISTLSNENLEVQGGWAGIRAVSQDRFPVVGAVPDTDNIYVSAAFGSHGIVGSLAAAHYLADIMRQGVKSLPINTLKALNPQRFIDRAQKKGQDLRKNMVNWKENNKR